MLRNIAPEELRKMNEWHKEMCQCITCATAKLMQQSLLAYRRSHLKRLQKMVAKKDREGDEEAKQHYQDRLDTYRSEVMDGEDMKHPNENVVAKALTCGAVVDGIPCWKCVTRECSDCPSLTWPKEESGEYEDGAPEISYRKWETRHTCNKHGILPLGYTTCHACNDASLEDEKYEVGKVSSKKRPSRKTEPVETFLPGEYSAAMNEYVWHKYHVLMLSNSVTGKARKAALRPGSVIGKYDYADRLKCVMNGQAQSDHFGNDIALSIEGAYIHAYSPESVEEYKTDRATWNNAEMLTEFYSHLSDDKFQNASTTYIHQSRMFKDLQERGVLLTSWPKPGDAAEGACSEVQEETDGATKQYRCGDSVHLNSMLSSEYKVAIDRATSAPTHGKGECDAKNGVDKKSVCEEMKITDVPEANEGDHVIKADAVEGDKRVSFAEEAARFLTRKHGSGGVVGGNKHKKREAAAKMKRCKYWTYKLSDNKFLGMKKATRGWKPGKRNKMMVHYNYRTDPDLGVGRCAARRIPCRCDACDKQLREPWLSGKAFNEQPRYSQNQNCKYWPVFKGMNDWIELYTYDGKDTDQEVVEEANEFALKNVAEANAADVKVGGYGAMDTDDPAAEEGYYLVQWKGLPFSAQEQMTTREGDVIQKGELVCEAQHLDSVGGEPRCFKATTNDTVVRMQYILAADVAVEKKREGRQTYDRHEVDEDEHDAIVDEIDRRERIDHVEDLILEAIDDGEDSDGSSDDDGNGNEDDNSSDNE